MAPGFAASDEFAFQLCPWRSAPSYYRLVLLHRWMNHRSDSNTTFTHVLLSKPGSMAIFKGFIPTQRMGWGWRCKCGPDYHTPVPRSWRCDSGLLGGERATRDTWLSGMLG